MSEADVYKTASGMVFRVWESLEGQLRVEALKPAGWVAAPIGLIGLRVAPTTVRLTARQVLRLPI